MGVSKKARGLGLGKEMIKMSIEIGRQLGCELYFACVSGIYSQKIFRDLDFTLMKEITYEDVKDRRGKTILNDTREHKKCQTVYLRL